MFGKLPVIPVLVGNAVAAVNAVVASSDLNAGRTAMSKQRGLYVKGTAIVGGLALTLFDKNLKFIEVADALLVSGTVLTTNELVFRLAQNSKGLTAVAPQGFNRPVAPAPAAPGVQARAYRRQQVPGVFG